MRQFLENQTGLSIYPILSLVIFLLFFAGVLMWTFMVDKRYLDAMRNLPLDADGLAQDSDAHVSSTISKAPKI